MFTTGVTSFSQNHCKGTSYVRRGLSVRFSQRPGGDIPDMSMLGVTVTSVIGNEFNVTFDGPINRNGVFGQLVYDKIFKDQKELFKKQPAPGFKPGTIPAFILPRIKYAAVRDLCKELCKAALEGKGIVPDEEQSKIVFHFPGVQDGDVVEFCRVSKFKPGDDITFSASHVVGNFKGSGVFPSSNNRE